MLLTNRQKTGIPWFGHDKTETINGYEAKVFSVSGVEMVTRTRKEHMSQEDIDLFEGKKMSFILLYCLNPCSVLGTKETRKRVS